MTHIVQTKFMIGRENCNNLTAKNVRELLCLFPVPEMLKFIRNHKLLELLLFETPIDVLILRSQSTGTVSAVSKTQIDIEDFEKGWDEGLTGDT